MARLQLLLLTILACSGAGFAAPQAHAQPPAAAPGSTFDSGDCGGVIVSVSLPDGARSRYAPGDWIEDFGVIVLRMRSYIHEEDFAYTCDVLDAILPTMVDLVGDPIALDTLTVELDNGVIQHYSCGDNSVTMHSIDPDNVTGIDTGWDNLFIHELTHAFQGDLLCEGDVPSWLTEGMAEAARYFVGEVASEASGRVVRHRRFDRRMAVYDMYNSAGEQVLGGRGGIAWRFNFDNLYQNAAGSVIVPALAQLGVGLDAPHPLARLTAEIRAEKLRGPPYHIFEAVDRAWSAPVDGLAPPSRWLRSRAVACPSVRDGEFVTLLPYYRYNNVNPPWVRIIQFARTGSSFDYYVPSGVIRFVGVFDAIAQRVLENTAPTVPDLDEGAYLIDLAVADQSGGTLEARSWMMVVNPSFVEDGLWHGVAVVFVDREGRPVNVPRDRLTFNGSLVTRVPGGVIVSPHDGSIGSLTFKIDGRAVGTVTATGALPRLVVIPVDEGAPSSVVTWNPYHPEPGGVVSLTIRRDHSSLTPGPGGAVEAVLYDMSGSVRATVSMAPSTEWTESFTAELAVPDDLSHGVLAFNDGTAAHQGCRFWPCQWFWGYEFETRAAGPSDIRSVRFDGTHLIVTFDGAVDSTPLLLRSATGPEGPWTDHPDTTPDQRGADLLWNVRGLIGPGSYFRVIDTGRGDAVLFTEYLVPGPTTVRLSAHQPFPNPGSDVVRWPFSVEAPTSATFEVYDVRGRRVFSSGPTPLFTGLEEFRWNSTSAGNRAPTGVYFLRVNGAGESFTRKIVIVR
jgi:hypothetical protein